MNKFLKQIGVFGLGLLLFFGANAAINYYLLKTDKLELGAVNTIILGDSHIEKGLDPELLPQARSFALTGEPYVLTFWKLKKFLESTSPDTIILGFSPQNISAYNDIKFTDKFWSTEMFKRAYPIEEFDKAENVPVDYLHYYKVLWKENSFFPRRYHRKYLGGYKTRNESHLNDFDKAIARHYYNEEGEFIGLSTGAVAYLDSIVSFNQKKGLTTILLNTPVHAAYYQKIPAEVKQKYASLQQKYKNQPQVQVLDYSQNAYPDSLYLDADHLNSYGSRKFSQELRQQLYQKPAQN